MLRRKRFGRLHTIEPHPTYEGILLGRWGGHYHLIHCKLLRGEGQSIAMDGHIEVPAENIVCFQGLEQ